MSSDVVMRKLTTILAADVVGYSRLTAADEEAALKTLKAYRGVIFDLIGKHHGRVIGAATDTMPSEDIEALMTGGNIQGISTATGRPFTIESMAGGTADVEFERRGAQSGAKSRDSGKWWAKDYRFCMQFSKFGRGRQLCPTLVRNGEAVTAVRGGGSPLQWTLDK